MRSDQLSFLKPDWPAPSNVHAVATTRAGGASVGPYASFNLGDHVNDVPEAVAANRENLRVALRLPSAPVWLRQVHGTDVVDASEVPAGTVADGAYTTRKGVVCAVLTADCLPVFLCNESGTEVAVLHAGWRGLAAGVVEAGLRALRSSPGELMAWLGPAIGANAYEVGEEVRQAFVASDAEAAFAFAPSPANGKWFMDIYELARRRLRACGVAAIYGGNYCTASQPSLFFSHRRDGVTGRMASIIWLR